MHFEGRDRILRSGIGLCGMQFSRCVEAFGDFSY
jgi:hypothetical protein